MNLNFSKHLINLRGVVVTAQILCIIALAGFVAVPGPVMAYTPPARTLPSYINRIYVREFKNDSRMFGAQADLTLHVNDEFMLDGRLDVVQSERSDVRLEGRIRYIRKQPSGFGSDEFPLITVLEMETVVELWDPYDPDRLVPLYRFNVPTIIQYISDPRRSISETDTEARERLLRQAAKEIVASVMSGVPSDLRPLEKKTIEKYQQRRGTHKYEPVVPEPRYPKATPVPRRNIFE